MGRKDGRARRHIATPELPTFKLPTLCEIVSRSFFSFFFLRFIAKLHGKSGHYIRVFIIPLSISLRKIIIEDLKISVVNVKIFKGGKKYITIFLNPSLISIPDISLHTSQFREFEGTFTNDL